MLPRVHARVLELLRETLVWRTVCHPPMSYSRIQWWALFFSAYHYSIEHRPGKHLANIDVFSRLPLLNSPAQVPMTSDTILLF